MDKILDAAIKKGLVKTKSEALRLGVLELNNKYDLLRAAKEDEEDLEYIKLTDKKLKSGKMKLCTEKELKEALK